MTSLRIRAKRKAVFLDRDGTINEDVGYPMHPAQVHFYPYAAEAIKRINQAGLLAIVVSHQSGVGRGYFTEHELEILHSHIKSVLEKEDARLDRIYYCPHYHPRQLVHNHPPCDCAKPRPGLAIQAAKEFNLDLNQSYMIGDKFSDLVFGQNIGAVPILVLTGYGQMTLQEAKATGFNPAFVARNVLEAVIWLLNREKTSVSWKA